MNKLKTTALMLLTSALTTAVFMLAPHGKVQKAEAAPPCSRYYVQPFSYYTLYVNGAAQSPNVWHGYQPGDSFNAYINTGCSSGYLPVGKLKAQIYVVNVGWVDSDTAFIEMASGLQSEAGTLQGSANEYCTEAWPSAIYISAGPCSGGGQ